MSTRNVLGIGIPTCREIVARMAPSDDEFLFVVALMFWSVGKHELEYRKPGATEDQALLGVSDQLANIWISDGISDCEPEVMDIASLEKVAIHKAMHAHYK